MAESGAISDGFSTQVQPASSAGMTFSVIWLIGQFHGVMRPQTPIGSRTITWPSAKGSSHSKFFAACRKPAMCQGPVAAWSLVAKSIGAPISSEIASPSSFMRRFMMASSFSSSAMRTSSGVAAQPGNAARAAATALSTSAFAPSEITAQASSVAGSMTSQSLGCSGATQAPSI